MNVLLEKLKDVVSSVLPVVVLIVLMNFGFVNMPMNILLRFLVSSFVLIIGLAIFQFGIELAISPMGEEFGSALTITNSVILVAVSGMLLGFLVSVAEPVLHILGGQIETITAGLIPNMKLVLAVAVGVGACICLGLLRTIYNIRHKTSFAVGFGIILVLGLLADNSFIPITFDSAGAVTGIITVPFILAVALGMARIKKDPIAAQADSFGLVGMTSVGAILAVLFLSVVTGSGVADAVSDLVLPLDTKPALYLFAQNFWGNVINSIMSLFPLVIFFLIANFTFIKLRKKNLARILKGVAFTYVGLTLFMLSTSSGFLDVGLLIGYEAAKQGSIFLCIMGALLGLVIVLAEPSVHVLTHQIEEVTTGAVRSKIVLIFIAVAVSVGVLFSMLRILIPGFQLWQIMLVGYGISVGLAFVVPDMFVGMAFDAGGVASGPMTATFAMYFAQGAALQVPQANVVTDGLGVIATVALAPVLSLQILGLIYKVQQDAHKSKHASRDFNETNSLLAFVVPYGMARKIVKHALKNKSQKSTVLLAEGSVRGAMLNFFGITETEKELILMAGTDTVLDSLALSIEDHFKIFETLKRSHSGIAFKVPLEFLYTRGKTYTNLDRLTVPAATEEKMENEKSAIFTVVNKGMANEVIDASLEAGARGGTILNARGSGSIQKKHVFNIDIEPEKEVILTIVEKEKLEKVIDAIKKSAEVETDGLGILFVVPLSAAFGIK